MTMVLQDAFEMAQRFLDVSVRPQHDDEIVICSCQEFTYAWVFGYNTRRFLVENEILASLAGNGPVVVPKAGGPAWAASSATPVEDQVEAEG
jgi:Immunity protein 35